MDLSYDVISQFAKVVNKDKKQTTETTVYGTIKMDADGNKYVQLDGSDQLTPLTDTDLAIDFVTATANKDDRVSVLIKDHTATVTGNLSSPATNSKAVADQLESFNAIVVDQVNANSAYIEKLQTDKAEVNELITGTAKITELENGKASIEQLEAVTGNIENLSSTYANIDFSNIDKVAMEYFYSQSGLIENVTVGDQTITGNLVGVTIRGDLIEGNTVKADKLVVKGDDGLFYKLNTEGLSAIDEGNVFGRDICVLEENVTNIDWIDDHSATVTTNGADQLLAIYFWLDPEKTYIFSYEGENCEVGMYGSDWTEILRTPANVVKDVVITGAHHCYFSPPTEGADLTTYTFRNVRIIEKEVYDKSKLDGSIIAAKSITATKINVSDLVAFDATIGGFNITDNSIYSGVKESVDNTTRGIYFNNNGEFAFGDAVNFMKYYQDSEGNYRLAISADSLEFSSNKSVIGGRNLYLGTRNFDSDKWINMDQWETWDPDGFGYREYGRYGAWLGLGQNIEVKAGETYTFSFYAKGDENAEITIYNTHAHTETSPGSLYVGSIPDEYIRYHFTFTVNEDCTICPRVENMTENGWMQIYGLKLEKGSVATDWSPAPEDAETSIEEAAKTATNFLEYDSSNGLQLGNKISGTWSGFRSQITSVAYNILSAAGDILASYGEKVIELGKNATDAIIKFCGGKGQIEYDADDDCLQLTADNVRLKGVEMASLYSNYTDGAGTFRNGAVHASPGQVQVTAGGGSDNSGITVNPSNIHMSTENYYISGTMHDSDNGGTYASVTKGNSGIWTYKKYSNGDVELWGTYWVTDMACTNTLGSMYRTQVFEPDAFPFTVYSPNLTASYESNGYGAMLWATTNTTNYSPPNYYLIRPVSGTITYGQINFHVYGKWKT